jgi:hypothetical protein
MNPPAFRHPPYQGGHGKAEGDNLQYSFFIGFAGFARIVIYFVFFFFDFSGEIWQSFLK